MLRDALNEMVLAYNDQGKEVPLVESLIEQVPVEVTGVWLDGALHRVLKRSVDIHRGLA